MGRRTAWIWAALAAALAAFAWWPLLELELLGWDSYPMIVAGRVTGFGELIGTFGEELMDGRYPLGHFWRPLVHLAFALDFAVWGLEPFGYHLTDLMIMSASAALTAGMAARLLRLEGSAALVGALTAGLVFALNPVHFEILPVAPRRADSLAVLFTLLALRTVLTDEPGRGRVLLAGVFCALAVASKETGVIAIAALALLLFARFGSALRMLWPALVPVALVIALRTLALDGLGGSEGTASLAEGLAVSHVRAVIFLRQLVLPPILFQSPIAGLYTLGLAAGALALLIVAARASGRAVLAPAGFLAAWAVALVLLTSTSLYDQGWYAYPFLPIWSLALALLAATGWSALTGGRAVRGGAALLLALVCVGLPVRGSPLFDDAADFRAASEAARAFLDRFEERVRATRPGSTVTLQQCPSDVSVLGEDGAVQREIFLFFSYSLEAYADLVFGEGTARVGAPGFPSTRATGPDIVDVTVIPAKLGMRR